MAKFLKNNSHKYRKIVLEKELVRKVFPFFKTEIRGVKLICRGWIQTSDKSKQYRIEIEYEPWNSPVTHIIEPAIEPNINAHMYPDGALCLFDWREQHWQNHWHLHETIVPWIAEWLVFYELYSLTGIWHGNSAIHAEIKEEEPRSNN
jgi:hypothetical protein